MLGKNVPRFVFLSFTLPFLPHVISFFPPTRNFVASATELRPDLSAAGLWCCDTMMYDGNGKGANTREDIGPAVVWRGRTPERYAVRSQRWQRFKRSKGTYLHGTGELQTPV
jgi:hypothetical protein